jgi:hypothetical protein
MPSVEIQRQERSDLTIVVPTLQRTPKPGSIPDEPGGCIDWDRLIPALDSLSTCEVVLTPMTIREQRIVVCFHEKAGPCQANSVTACHSLVKRNSPASRSGAVQAERSEPAGSLDGLPRCQIVRDEGMAGYPVLALTVQRSSPHRPPFIRTFLKP